MKNIDNLIGTSLTIVGLLVMVVAGCKKADENSVPVLSTSSVSAITATSAISGGNVTFDGGSTITERGVCWSTSQNPTIADSKSTDGSKGVGIFSFNISGLTQNTTYYVRAYATNNAGTGYGDVKTFTTSDFSAFVGTFPATKINMTSATLNGKVNANNLSNNVTFEYGTTTSYGNTITAAQSPIIGNTFIDVSAEITGLSVGVIYHFRVKSVNSLGGVEYGKDGTFCYLYIGVTYQGGIVFYIDGTGHHGLICAPNDQTSNVNLVEWGCNNTTIGGTSSAINTGNANTNSIVTGCNTVNIAARICFDLELNSYNDWYLPSKDELNLIFTNLVLRGLGGLSNVYPSGWYWSSTEESGNMAWIQWVAGGSTNGIQEYKSKTGTYSVRSIRTF